MEYQTSEIVDRGATAALGDQRVWLEEGRGYMVGLGSEVGWWREGRRAEVFLKGSCLQRW